MTARDYFAAPGWSATSILAFRRSPQYARDLSMGLAEIRASEAMNFGTIAHAVLLEDAEYITPPETYGDGDGKKWNWNANECKAWRDRQTAHVVSPSQAFALRMMRERMPLEIMRDILACDAEVPLFGTVSGLPAKCKADLLGDGRIFDLKTISDIASIERNVARLGYHIRAEWYRRVAQAATGKRHTFEFLFVETSSPWRWRRVELDAEYQMIAEHELNQTIRAIQLSIETDSWVDPGPIHMRVSPPSWANFDDEEEEYAALS